MKLSRTLSTGHSPFGRGSLAKMTPVARQNSFPVPGLWFALPRTQLRTNVSGLGLAKERAPTLRATNLNEVDIPVPVPAIRLSGYTMMTMTDRGSPMTAQPMRGWPQSQTRFPPFSQR